MGGSPHRDVPGIDPKQRVSSSDLPHSKVALSAPAGGGGRAGLGAARGGIIFNCVSSIVMAEAAAGEDSQAPGTGACRRAKSASLLGFMQVCPKVCGGPGWAWAHVVCAAAPCFVLPPPPHHTPTRHHNPPNSLSLSTYPSFLVRAPSASRHSVQYKMFVCHICKSALQSFSIRVKSVSMSTFDIDEVKGFAAKRGGNEAAAQSGLGSSTMTTTPGLWRATVCRRTKTLSSGLF